jgi:hypothetical protein
MEDHTRIVRYSSNLRIVWDLFLTLVTAAAFVEYSYRFTFRRTDPSPLAWLIAAVFVADIVLSFRSEIRKKLTFVSDLPSITREYLGSWFVADLVAALPIAGIGPLLHWQVGPGAAGTLLLAAVWLLPLVKTAKLFSTGKRIQERLKITPGVMRLVVFGFMFILAAHTMGLGWVLIGASEAQRPHIDQYLRAIYWCMTTIATIGYGDYYPNHDSNLQIIYTIAVQVIGVGFYGYIIGNMASLIANLDVARATFMKKMEEINNFMRTKRVPHALQDRVHDYFAYLWETRKSASTISVIEELPHTLAMSVMLFLNRSIIEKVSLFRNANEIFIRETIQLLRPLVYLPDDYIIRQGEFGDCMYFLSSGDVEVVVNGQRVAQLGAGSPFGETALIQGEKRNASIRTLTYCDVYKLQKEDFDALRRKYPEFDEQVKQVVEARIKDTAAKMGSKAEEKDHPSS